MLLRTEVTVTKSLLTIDLNTPVLTIGSCFSEEMGKLLETNKFNILNNPFGTSFNPISIAEILTCLCEKRYSDPLPLQQEDVWIDYRFHASIYGYRKEELYHTISTRLEKAHSHLLSAPKPIIIITLGTAWVYSLLSTKKIVNNCHKQNQHLFNKELCSSDHIRSSFHSALHALKNTFPGCEVILTLSPVRHIKDGLEENQISKSMLRMLCHEVSTEHAYVHYFPSYEIVLDDLRDYRFYNTDLIHPNALAIAYTWEKFSDAFFDKNTKTLVDEWQQVQQQLNHRPFYDKSAQYKKFLQHTLNTLERLNTKMNLTQEIDHIKHKLEAFKSHES